MQQQLSSLFLWPQQQQSTVVLCFLKMQCIEPSDAVITFIHGQTYKTLLVKVKGQCDLMGQLVSEVKA